MLDLPEVFAVADWVLALITGGSAVLGSLVGGGITGYFALKGERKRQEFAESVEQRKEEREDQATLAVACGAAREWARILSEDRVSIKTALDQGHWWPSDEDVQRFTFHEDRKLVASVLSPEDFRAVEAAEFALYNALMMRNTLFEGTTDEDPFPPITKQNAEQLSRARERLSSAERVLRAVGEPPG
jgi:hypothetical protein